MRTARSLHAPYFDAHPMGVCRCRKLAQVRKRTAHEGIVDVGVDTKALVVVDDVRPVPCQASRRRQSG
jgi:hypothetical protein